MVRLYGILVQSLACALLIQDSNFLNICIGEVPGIMLNLVASVVSFKQTRERAQTLLLPPAPAPDLLFLDPFKSLTSHNPFQNLSCPSVP